MLALCVGHGEELLLFAASLLISGQPLKIIEALGVNFLNKVLAQLPAMLLEFVFAPVAAVLAIVFAVFLALRVVKQPSA